MIDRAAATALPALQSMLAFIRLPQVSDTNKDTEILVLRHQLIQALVLRLAAENVLD
jgi:hypothetical protein